MLTSKRLLPPCLSGSTLKFIAIFTMLIDHIGAVFLEQGYIMSYNLQSTYTPVSYEFAMQIFKINRVFRTIGRIAFPIFCFLLLQGFLHTSNRKKYALRLFLFALLSEIPFDLSFKSKVLEFSYQNVMFTLLIGLLTIWAVDELRKTKPSLCLLPAAIGLLLGWFIKTDYSWKGVLLILIMYLFTYQPMEQTIAGCLALLWEPAACFAFIPINMYNEKKGRRIKYFFYLFYPVHLLILYLIRYIIFRY